MLRLPNKVAQKVFIFLVMASLIQKRYYFNTFQQSWKVFKTLICLSVHSCSNVRKYSSNDLKLTNRNFWKKRWGVFEFKSEKLEVCYFTIIVWTQLFFSPVIKNLMTVTGATIFENFTIDLGLYRSQSKQWRHISSITCILYS